MYLAPLNYDRFFKKIFSDTKIAKQFLEDFFEFTIEEIEALPLSHKLTNEANLIHFDYRCKVDGEYIIIDMQQWYKHDVVKRFYLYHAANSVLQLEDLPLKQIGKEKQVKDYSGVLPVKTLIWLVDDALDFTKDYSIYTMLPEEVGDFLTDTALWSTTNEKQLRTKRKELLKVLENDTKNLLFLKKNQLIFAFQKNIVKNLNEAFAANQSQKPYMRWFEFAAKTRNKDNKPSDFKKFQSDAIFEEIMRKLNHASLNPVEKDYMHYFEELEGIAEVKWKEGRKEGVEIGVEMGVEIGVEQEKRANILAAIQQGILSEQQISALFQVSLEFVKEVKRNLSN